MSTWDQALEAAQAQLRLFVPSLTSFLAGDYAPLDPDEHLLYLGTHAVCYDACCRRQIADASLAPLPPLSVLAPYLSLIERQSDEAPRLDHPSLLERRPPLYFDCPVASDHLVYVDLDRAYWQIYTRTTLDVVYDGTRPPYPGVVTFLDAKRLGEDKLVRNALLGMLRREWRSYLDHGHAGREKIGPWRRRPNLWGLVMDCLELVAWAARDGGASYVHTDGYIFAHRDLAEEFIATAKDLYGLTASVRAEGDGEVWGLSSFRLGDHATSRQHPGQRVDTMINAPHDLADGLQQWLRDSSMIS